MMLSLGPFAFSLDTLPYQELQRRSEWRWSANARVGARPAAQFVGLGEDTITLSGHLLPSVAGDPASLDTLRDMAGAGEAWPLVDGQGVVHGAYVITSLDDRRSTFFADGAARRVEFDLRGSSRTSGSSASSITAGGLWRAAFARGSRAAYVTPAYRPRSRRTGCGTPRSPADGVGRGSLDGFGLPRLSVVVLLKHYGHLRPDYQAGAAGASARRA